MTGTLIVVLRTLNEILTAGIAITAFSLLLYALTFNLRDRVTRSFAIILLCVVIVFVGEAISSTTDILLEIWLRVQWVGIIFLPPAYIHFSDALLSTTGRPSRGRRRRLVRLIYLISFAFLLTLPLNLLVGPVVNNVGPAPHLQRTWLTWVFSAFYLAVIGWSWINFWRSYKRSVTRASRRRMRYLLAGAMAPALGSYPFLLFGSGFALEHPLFFWLAAFLSNLTVSFLLVVMAYAVAFFGVAWPDRVVKQRLVKWLMRGPVTASTVLAVTTMVRRLGDTFGFPTLAIVPVLMVATVLILEHLITLAAPVWERWLFHGGDRANISLVQTLEDRLLTSGDLREFLESVLAAVCDRLQVSRAFVVALEPEGPEMLLTLGVADPFEQASLPEDLLQAVAKNGGAGVGRAEHQSLFTWKDYWLVPLSEEDNGEGRLLGFLAAARSLESPPDEEQIEALLLLAQRASLALEDRKMQQQIFTSLRELTPQVDLIQRLRAAARYDGLELLSAPEMESRNLARWVKDALTHYWGGPKLSQSPLLRLQVVQRAMEVHDSNPTNALRSILNIAIERVRPEGERRFTADWILYNILELKFMEGRKVREVARRLAMSEADLYRKQRVAIESVAKAILGMEQEAREEQLFSNENLQG
ncbi:MAG TPA: GAF domain-containing protein [Anaerolineales bacterium]|nr:GAF domain-containing protein [Anaerolineales bacterium]